MLQWLLLGGASLLAAIWVTIAAARAPAGSKPRATGIAAVQAVAVVALVIALAGSMRIAWLLLSAS